MTPVTINADIDGKTRLFTVELQATVGQSITAECEILPNGYADVPVVSMATSELFNDLGIVQTNKFTKDPIDAVLNLNSLTLPMYIVDASYNMGFGSYELKKTLISKFQKLSSLQTYIYSSIKGIISAIPDAPAAPLATILKTVLEAMIKNWNDSWGLLQQQVTEGSRKITESIHANNEKVLAIWYAILDASADTTVVVEIDKAEANTRQNLYAWVNNVYLSQAEDFTAIVDTFLSGLNLMYIPPLNGGSLYGVLVNKDAVMATPMASTLIIESTQTRFRPSATLPVTSVIVETPGGNQVLSANDPKQGPPATILVSWPESGVSLFGKVQKISPPPWLPIATDTAGFIPSTQDLETSGTPLNALATKTLFNAQIPPILNTQKDLTKILTRWAKQAYIDSTIKYDAITVHTPLDVSWEIGKRYELSSYTDGFKLFTGFLNDVTHTVEKSSTRSGREGAAIASTILSFSHVEAGDFKLPNSSYT